MAKGDAPGKGWFHIDGVQTGDRQLAEQMAGLEWFKGQPGLLAGASILDIGCAEGLIGMEFLEMTMGHGMKGNLVGLEMLPSRVKTADEIARARGLRFYSAFVQHDAETFHLQSLWAEPFDVVLALAIAHKLKEPGEFLRAAAGMCRKFMAIRLPGPVIHDRRSGLVPFDVPELMLEAGFYKVSAGYFSRGEWTGIFKRAR